MGEATDEQELRRAIVDALGDGFFRVGVDGTILEVNDAFCRIVGFRADEVIGATVPHPWWLDDPETLERWTARLQELATGVESRVEFEDHLRARDGRVLRVAARVSVLRSGAGGVVGFVGTVRDTSDRYIADERAGRLVDLTGALSPALREHEVLDAIIDGVMDAVDLDGAGLLLPTADGDDLAPRRHRGMGWTPDEEPLPIEAELPPTVAFREARALYFSDPEEMIAEFPATEPLTNLRAIKARASIPLMTRSGPTAVLHLLFPESKRFDENERMFLAGIAERCGLALERASLAERHLHDAERAEALQHAFAKLAEATTPRQIADTVLHEAVPALGGRAGSVSLLDESRSALDIITYAGMSESSMEGWDTLPLDADLPGTDAVREGAPVYLRDRQDIAERYPEQVRTSRAVGDQAWAALPLMTGTRAVGLLFVNFLDRQPFDPSQRLALETLADRTAAAVARARTSLAEHEVAMTLQHSLLPLEVVRRPSVDIATRYEAGAEGVAVGGDWFDSVALPDGRIALVVGDVVGRGIGAAAAMGKLRSALRALALQGHGPSAVLQDLDAFAHATPGTQMATVVYAELHPDTGELDYACAGHLPPIVLRTDGTVQSLDDGRSPLLEVMPPDASRPSARVRLHEGDLLVLYTDGLTERRGEAYEIGVQRVLDALAKAGDLDPEGVCDLLLEQVAPDESRVDDVAILCARYRPTPAHIVTIDATPEQLGELRAAVDAWLTDAGVPAAARPDLVLAASEAGANAIEHAYREGAPGRIEVQGTSGPEIVIRVIDTGSWREPVGDPTRGRGLAIMRALLDGVEVERSDEGTTVALRRSPESTWDRA